MHNTVVRRGVAIIATITATVVALGACAGSDDGDANADATAAAGESSGQFPVTVQTAYGDVTIDQEPVRIAALSSQYIDMLNAIDVAPTASDPGYSQNELAENAPWLEGLDYGEIDTELVNSDGAASLEQIASYEPDLILAGTWNVSETTYEQFSQIAPTYVGRTSGNDDWTDTLEDVGQLTGGDEAAAAAYEDVQSAYAAAREQIPGLDGLTYTYLGFMNGGLQSGNGSWLDGFGLKPADNQDNTQTSDPIALENLDQLDSDVVVIWLNTDSYDELAQDPRFEQLPAVVNNAFIEVDLPLAIATNSPGPASLRYAIDRVLPSLQASAYADG